MIDMRILIVEDDELLAKALAWKLQKDGYEPLVVKDGVYGLQEAAHFKPHLILLDLTLPGEGGAELLDKLRHQGDTKNIPVIIVTGSWDEGVRREVMALGAQDYLRKPFSVDALNLKIVRILTRARAA